MTSDGPRRVTRTRRRFLTSSGVEIGSLLSKWPDLAAGGASSGGSLPAHLDERVPGLLGRYDVPGVAIALVTNGKVTWSGAYGDADPAMGRPTTVETLFRTQSITKSVTAWGVLKLVEQGEIDLTDPVGNHITSWQLPDAEYPWDQVTVQRLLSHSAGLPAGVYEGVPIDEEPASLRKALSGDAEGPAARPISPPEEFRYSNPGYALLELLIEDVTGRDFTAYMDEEILRPLEMDQATFSWSNHHSSKLATEHYVDGTPVAPSHGPANAHGGLYATIEDVARFVAAGTLTNNDRPAGRGVLSPESVEALYTPAVETTGFYALSTDSAGLGHFVEPLSDGRRAVMHGGQGAGSWSWFHAIPETGDGIVILTNSERSLQLIADVVGAWVDQRGLPSVALMRAQRWVRLPVWILVGVAAGLILRLGYGVITGKRAFAPRSKRDRTARMILGGLAVTALAFWWTFGRGTVGFFLPVIADWVGLALSVVVVLLMVTILFPRTKDDETK